MDDATRQGIFGAVVQLPNAAAVESLLADFEEGAEQKLRLEIFDGEAGSIRGLGEAPVTERLAPRHPPARGIQLSRGIVIEVGHRTGSKIEIKHCLNRQRTNSAAYISTECNNTNAPRELFRSRDNRSARRHGRTVSYTVRCRRCRWERFGFAGCNKCQLPFVSADAGLIDARYGKRRGPRGQRNPQGCRRKSPRVISIQLCRQESRATTMPERLKAAGAS